MSQPKPSIGNGRYALHDIIGQGAMGEVYRGTDTFTNEPVAVKVIKAELVSNDTQSAERFEREAETLRKLNHPNIVKMFARIQEGGVTYIIMELVGGGDLRRLMQAGKLTVKQALEIALDLADALARAHRQNIIHRDIKPANVLLAEDGTPRLSDFGIAKMTDRTSLTESGVVLGTYAYISPELCMGELPSPQSDIWAFGVMLYEMLAARRPFNAENPLNLLRIILVEPLPDISEFRDDLPPSLITLLKGMLEKDPQKRIPSARIVSAQIEAILNGTDMHDIVSTAPMLAGEVTGEIFVNFSDLTPPQTPSEKLANMQQLLGGTPTPFIHREPAIGRVPAQTAIPSPIGITKPPVAAPAPARNRWGLVIGLLLTLLVVGGVILALIVTAPRRMPVLPVLAVAQGDVMVLVADFEPIGNTIQPDPGRFIADNLRDVFERAFPYGNLAIREYNAVITSDAQAQQVAQDHNALIVVWGNYSDGQIQANVHAGADASLPASVVNPVYIAPLANIRVVMTNALTETLAYNVAAAAFPVLIAHNRPVAAMDALATVSAQAEALTPPPIIGSGVNSHWHRYIIDFGESDSDAQTSIQAARELNPANPILYFASAITAQRLGQSADAQADLQTALRLNNDYSPNWTSPYYLLGTQQILLIPRNLEQTDAYFREIIERTDDDWMAWSFLGVTNALQRDFDGAYTAFNTAITLNPDEPLAKTLLVPLLLRRGELSRAREYGSNLMSNSNSYALHRLTRLLYGDSTGLNVIALVEVLADLSLGRYEDAIENSDAMILFPELGQQAEPYMLQGLAYCNLGRYEDAVNAYTRAIQWDESFALLYALRAESYAYLNETVAARADLASAREFSPSEEFNRLLLLGTIGAVSCRTMVGDNDTPLPEPSATEEPSATGNSESLTAVPAGGRQGPPGGFPPGGGPPQRGNLQPLELAPAKILVVAFEPLNGVTERNPERFIADQLERVFVQTLDGAPYVVERLDNVVRTASDAAYAAETLDAALVVWGHYDDSSIEARVQVGVTDSFAYSVVERSEIEQLATMTVRLQNEREQSVAAPVLAALHALHDSGTGLGNIGLYELQQTTPIVLEDVEILSPIPALYAAGVENFISNPEAALDAFVEAETLTPDNPLILVAHAATLVRLNQRDEVPRMVDRALALGGDSWALPYRQRAAFAFSDQPQGRNLLRDLELYAEAAPAEWFVYLMYGLQGVTSQDTSMARGELAQAIMLESPEAIAQAYTLPNLIRSGEFRANINLVRHLRGMNDTGYTALLFEVMFGPDTADPLAALYRLSLDTVGGDYAAALALAESMRDDPRADGLVDVYFLGGIAACNLNEDDAALAFYNDALELSPEDAVLYLLRAEILDRLNDPAAAEQDRTLAVGLNSYGVELNAKVNDPEFPLACATIFED
ncbi:MAG: protein kinase domain-containing protein [Phototrophicaceae bacterium]|jgi:tetratricopeptide (TPR) repeat protein/tRNA A-37 threonylcarbamoyl transferase component Bud32